jgi:hypothetical protein
MQSIVKRGLFAIATLINNPVFRYTIPISLKELKEVLAETSQFLDVKTKEEIDKCIGGSTNDVDIIFLPSAIVASLARLDMIKQVWTDEEFTKEFA